MTRYQRGDIVEVGDPFTAGDATRPFLVVNTDSHPFHEEQYIAVALTTRTWYDETMPLSETDFVDGGVPEDSSIVPWGVTSPATDDVTDWFGRVEQPVVDEAVKQLVGYLRR